MENPLIPKKDKFKDKVVDPPNRACDTKVGLVGSDLRNPCLLSCLVALSGYFVIGGTLFGIRNWDRCNQSAQTNPDKPILSCPKGPEMKGHPSAAMKKDKTGGSKRNER